MITKTGQSLIVALQKLTDSALRLKVADLTSRGRNRTQINQTTEPGLHVDTAGYKHGTGFFYDDTALSPERLKVLC